MLQHRRTLIVVLAALALVSVYRFRSISRSYESPSWIHRGRKSDDILNGTLGFEKIFVINLPARRGRRDAMTVASAVSNINLTFIEGLTGDGLSSSTSKGGITGQERAATKPLHSASAGARGSWRSHMNVLQAIVGQGLGSALVLEDDVDWDVRLKAQMRTFAAASRTWLDAQGEKRDGVSRAPKGQGKQHHDPKTFMPAYDTIPLSPDFLSRGPGLKRSAQSPYGDDWDVLWLGHCGADLPSAQPDEPSAGPPFPPSLIVSILDDATVPAPKHLKPHPFALRDRLADAYPAHTRVVHAVNGNVCSLAYAVSQRGARKLLWRFNQEGFVDQWDLMLRDYCMGGYEDGDGGDGDEDENERRGEPPTGPVCLTVQPPLISHHYAGEAGGASVSNIRGQGGGLARVKKGTSYVRLSVQENLKGLLAGLSVDELVDQLPDDGDTLW
ncbi:hypothetical protein F5Y10DRAFT_290257 [Nemania abortiva]|nr:hypothetical protein F5Y10DRAFT_290257 [Nemania abortiva]